jgi:hypothetical protein
MGQTGYASAAMQPCMKALEVSLIRVCESAAMVSKISER